MTVLKMKVIVVLLGLIATTVLTGMSWFGAAMIAREEWRELGTDCAVLSTQLTGVAAVTVRIRAYSATGNITPEHIGRKGAGMKKDCEVQSTQLTEATGEHMATMCFKEGMISPWAQETF